jgi:tetratricopeptide (TPR) repeat protein
MLAHLAVLRLRLATPESYRQVCQAMLINFDGHPGLSIKLVVNTAALGVTEVSDFRPPASADDEALVAWTCSLGPGVVPPAPPPRGQALRSVVAHESDSMLASEEMIRVAGYSGAFGQPLALAERAVSSDPGNYVYARALAATLYRANRLDEAIEQLQRAMALRKQPSPSVWLFLAMAHHRLGHKEEAQKWLENSAQWIEQARSAKPETETKRDEVYWSNLPWTEQLTLELLQREAEEQIKAGKP